MRELKLKSKQLNKRKGIFGTAIVHRSAVPKYRGVSPSQRFISGNQKNPYLSFQQNYLPPSHCTASIHRYISAVNSSSRDRNKNKRQQGWIVHIKYDNAQKPYSFQQMCRCKNVINMQYGDPMRQVRSQEVPVSIYFA